ncbi:hypothetical protein PCANC_07329 [Puccinia coronata f. sp. avenae]|uniref:Uncharacterized protein n=1 Tax=Puccinia coronata f. sp. avenae TaxID=200324 RepID=A0A2N5T6H7_9BASI|nr:hypothetical protein PCANC_07329 [Puccinia coronata f. sp. avenae]
MHHMIAFGTNGLTKKAQSVDDLLQFGLLPKPRIQLRLLEELGEHRQGGPNHGTSFISTNRTDPRDLHNRFDQIGKTAGSLAAINCSSKRNTARLNSTLSASTKPSKPSNRHLLTGSILSSSSNKSSRSNKPSNSNTTSAHSSLADTTLILPSSAPSPISPSDTTSPLSSSSTTPHPTLSFGNLTVKKKNTK